MTTFLVLAVGSAVVVAILHGLARGNPGGARRSAPLVSLPQPPEADERPAGLVEWEALLLTASTSGPRGRARLARHLEPLVAAALRDGHGLSLDDPRAAALLGAEWSALRDGAPLPGRGGDDAAVIEAVNRLLDRVATPRSVGSS